jgi:hypothetical protein
MSPAFFEASIATARTCFRLSCSTDAPLLAVGCVAILVDILCRSKDAKLLWYESLDGFKTKALPEDSNDKIQMPNT